MARAGDGERPKRIRFAVLDSGSVRSSAGAEPSAGIAGRMELLAIWAKLSRDRRKALLVVARKIAEAPER